MSDVAKDNTVADKERTNRARLYRDVAAKTRTIADAMADLGARQGMLDAADVWDKLAELLEHPDAGGPFLPGTNAPPRRI